MVDEKDFFREATLRICGKLEIEQALWDCLMYIRQYIPADMIQMMIYHPETGAAETLAKADRQGGQICSDKRIIQPEARHIIDAMIQDPNRVAPIMWAERVSEHPVMGLFSDMIDNPNAAYLVIRPKPEWNMLGGIAVLNYAGKKYSDDHVRLFSLLNEPFAIAFSNYIRYREVLRLKDILADDNRYLQDELRQQTGEEIVGAKWRR